MRRKNKKNGQEKSCRCPYFFTFCRGYEGAPLSPEGEAVQGVHPLAHPPPSFPSLKRISRQSSEEISHFFLDAPVVRTKATIAAG